MRSSGSGCEGGFGTVLGRFERKSIRPTTGKEGTARGDGGFSGCAMCMKLCLDPARLGKRVIGVRWVETNKGTADQPKVRSRLVAQEFARGKTPEEMYAPTPSLMATRWLVSEAASQGMRGPGSVR